MYEILNGGTILATLPNAGQSPQLAALRAAYDLSLRCAGPISLWKIAWGGNTLEVCRLLNGAALPLTEN